MLEVFDYLQAQVLNHHAPLKKMFHTKNKWLTRKLFLLNFPETNQLDENYNTFLFIKARCFRIGNKRSEQILGRPH